MTERRRRAAKPYCHIAAGAHLTVLRVGRLARDELVDVAIRSPEVLPRRSWFAQQLDACPSQLVHGRGQVADREADNRPVAKCSLPG